VIYRFRAEVWLHGGDASWHFLTLPTEVADEIDLLTEGERRGFGSVRVEVTIGSTTWRTSIFPDNNAESYVLPVKKPVRTAEDIEDGDVVDVVLELVDRPSALA
jgi:hypothetical protein